MRGRESSTDGGADRTLRRRVPRPPAVADWGAALGGIAGFFAGAKFSACARDGGARGDAWSRPAVGAASPIAARKSAARSADVNARRCARRVEELERRVASLERGAVANASGRAGARIRTRCGDDSPAVRGAASRRTDRSSERRCVRVARCPRRTAPAPRRRRVRRSRHRPPPSPRANPFWAWFTGGNALTRIGVVIMFFGVAFLLKYFAEHFTVSIELRLAAVAAFGSRADRCSGLRFARRASGLRAVAAGRRCGHPLPDDVCRVPAVRRAAGGAGDRAARRRVGAHRRARRAQRFAAARGARDRRRIPRADAGRRRAASPLRCSATSRC